jgi:MAX-like protein X
MTTFNQTVSVGSMDEMCRTSLLWVDQHCSLVELRPGILFVSNTNDRDLTNFFFLAISNKLRHLSTTTDILSDPPSTLREEVMKAIASSRDVTSNSSEQ